MVSYKLDKYDKYFVAFICVIVTIFSIGQCFAIESIEIEPYTISNCVLSQNQTINYVEGYTTYFVPLEKGFSYRIELSLNGSQIRTAFSNSTEYGSNIYLYSVVNDSYSVVINANDYDYFYFDFGSIGPQGAVNYKIIKYQNESMTGTVDKLVSNVGINQLWSVFESGIDFVGIVVLVAFGLFLIVLLIKKLSKGKSDF